MRCIGCVPCEPAVEECVCNLQLKSAFADNSEINGGIVCCAPHGLVTRVKLCDGGWKALQARIVGVLSVCFCVQFFNVRVRLVSVVGQPEVVEYALSEFVRRKDARRWVFGLHAMRGRLNGRWWLVVS